MAGFRKLSLTASTDFLFLWLARASHVKTRAEEKERKRKRKGQWKRLRDGWILDPPSVSSLPPRARVEE